MSSGDVSMAYDLNFTNSSGSDINSAGPLSINSGETFGSSNLTLQTYNSGKIILNSSNLYNDGTYFGIGTTAPTSALTVAGNGSLTGNLNVGGSLTTTSSSVIGKNLSVGGTFVSVGSTNLVTNLNADALDGLHASSFLQVGTSGNFISNLTGGTDISIVGSGVGRTINNTSTLSSVTSRGASTSTMLNLLGGAYFGSTNQSILKNDGTIGIGTTNPIAPIEIAKYSSIGTAQYGYGLLIRPSDSSYAARFAFNSGGAAAGSQKVILMGESSNGTGDLSIKTSSNSDINGGTGTFIDRFIVTNAGNVGIGTTNPTEKLDVNGNIRFLTLTNSYGLIGKDSAGTNLFSLTRQSNNLSITSYDGIGFAANQTGGPSTTYNMFIDNGNVGIGTTNPQSTLNIVSAEIGTGVNKGLRIDNYSFSKGYSIRTGISGVDNTSLAIYDETAGANRLTISTNGNVNISTNLSVGGTLTLSQGAANGYVLSSDASGNASWQSAAGLVSGTYVPYTGATGDVNLNNKALFNVSKVAIGLGATSSYSLDVNGKIAINGTQTIYNAEAFGGFIGSLFIDILIISSVSSLGKLSNIFNLTNKHINNKL
jgi:hypothetical protein